jgi:signal peptidase I
MSVETPEVQPDSSANRSSSSLSGPSSGLTSKASFFKIAFEFVRESIEFVLLTLILLVIVRNCLVEARYIPSGSMEPTLQVNDRILVEKLSGLMGSPVKRGDIIVFYPPPDELGGKDIGRSTLAYMGRLTGLPFLYKDTAYIKRVIGLPGEKIRIQKDVGIFVDDQLLVEDSYAKELPNYDLNVLGDIGGRNAEGDYIKPYGDSNEPIIVPARNLFLLGDNRNSSEDSHVWGFLDQSRIVGKTWLLFWRPLEAKGDSPSS